MKAMRCETSTLPWKVGWWWASKAPDRCSGFWNYWKSWESYAGWQRIRQERADAVAEATVRRFVRERKQELGLTARETFVPQVYDWGGEAQVDWYEAVAEIGGERQSVHHFAMRSMASGGAFHVAYYHATQQAFLEAHESAFGYFGGVFRRLRQRQPEERGEEDSAWPSAGGDAYQSPELGGRNSAVRSWIHAACYRNPFCVSLYAVFGTVAPAK
jgi:hypothetical protein